MKVRINLDVSDDQRVALASLIAGKPVKRMAGRDDFHAYVQGAVARLGSDCTGTVSGRWSGGLPSADTEVRVLAHLQAGGAGVMVGKTPEAMLATGPLGVGLLTLEERETVRRLRAEGREEGYIVGWLKAGRPARRA